MSSRFQLLPDGSKLKPVYRRSKFLEVLIEIRQEMAREADFDTDLFAEMVRSGRKAEGHGPHSIIEAPKQAEQDKKSAKRSAQR